MPNVTNPKPHTGPWLSLTAAAGRLSVHAATLRRWADQGDISYILTPGGHRRFAVADVERFAESRRVTQRALTLPETWAAEAVSRARQDMPRPADAHWLAALDDQTRERHRALGRRLMGLTLQYVSAADGEHLLDEARELGREYGELSKAAAMPLTDALQAALYFRDKLLEVTLDMPDTARVRHGDNARLVKRINTLLNAVQLATAQSYEEAPPVSPTSISIEAKRRRK